MGDVFSVIVTVYNNSEFMVDCIDSILIQEFPHIEIIIADDSSKNFDCSYYSNYLNQHRKDNVTYKIYSNKTNLGTVKNLNKAICMASGNYIKLIAIDDALSDSCSLRMAKEYLDGCDSDIIVTDYMICDSKMDCMKTSNISWLMNSGITAKRMFKRLCFSNCIPAQGVFFKKDFFSRFGLFNEEYFLLEDWPKWLEITQKGFLLTYTPFVSTKYRKNCGNGTGSNPLYLNDKKKAFTEYVKANKASIGYFYYSFCFLRFLLTSSIKVRKIYGFLFRR